MTSGTYIVRRHSKQCRLYGNVVNGAAGLSHVRLKSGFQAMFVEHVTTRAQLCVNIRLLANSTLGGSRHLNGRIRLFLIVRPRVALTELRRVRALLMLLNGFPWMLASVLVLVLLLLMNMLLIGRGDGR
jgi:hypothetical protein